MIEPTEQTLDTLVVGEKPDPLEYTFTDADGDPLDIDTFDAVIVFALRGSETSVSRDAVAGAGGKATYTWDGTELTEPGEWEADIWVGDGSLRYCSDRIIIPVRRSAGPVPDI